MDEFVRCLERMERENRRWRVIGVLALAALCLVVLVGASGERNAQILDEIRARQILLVDSSGVVRGGLRTASDGSVALSLADSEGKLRTGLAVPPDGSPHLRFYDGAGKPRGGLIVTRDGSLALALADKNGVVRLWAAVTEMLQVPVAKGQRLWKPVTTLSMRDAAPELYPPLKAELAPSPE